MRQVTLAALLALSACSAAPVSADRDTAGPHRNPSPGATKPAMTAKPVGTPYLPEPTGGRPVGMTNLHLKDTSRSDPWVPSVKARELMVSLWFPAKKPGRTAAPYMTPKESELLLTADGGVKGVPLDLVSRTRTNAFTDAEPAGRKHGLPLAVLSPGFTKPRATQTALAEDLASRGYAVVVIGHTYENVATSFPDGRVATCVACDSQKKDEAFWDKVAATRAADVSFVLDHLTAWKGADLIDMSRIAMAGHSAGGASAVAAMVKDRRLLAGMNIDGTAFAEVPAKGLARPFMFLGSEAVHSPGGKDPSWDAAWKRLTGWKRWITVAGTEHASFTDVALVAEQFGLPLETRTSATRATEITRRYVAAFFDLHLRGKPQPLLDGPSAGYPEVTSHPTASGSGAGRPMDGIPSETP
ncbi:alpha/beta hydrolase family protein [Nonomuraea sp. NPDC050556]|uniref:alpha/beta hydrolase family protein n=1 Tax=Nonomuraea sp. NPDC050556 TaxID=3364369 RepID=UPI0037B1E486